MEVMKLSTGLSNNTNTTESSACKPNSSGTPAAVISPESEQKGSGKTCQEVAIQVVSLSSKQELPKPSDLGQKCKIVASPSCRHRKDLAPCMGCCS